MAKHGKRYVALLEKIDKSKEYQLDEALKTIKEIASTKFDETVELAVELGVDPRKADQMVRGSVVLPRGLGKTTRVAVITRGEEEKEAIEAGADYVGYQDLIEKIRGGWLEFDALVATPDVMPELAKLGKVLGPRGLMPSPKTGTVTKDVGRVVRELKMGRIEFRVDKTGNVHVPVGKVSFPESALKENVLAFFQELINVRPKTMKGTYIKQAYISTTMGPSIKLDLNSILQQMERV
ncbi:MAG TPA: 50S ribosomal protein L1 [Candidatus Hydrothermia bacterium]|nr:50S ribosomal protein L1 [Candidatus Hydrothermae bacterium]MDD3648914.1 50S ribosomal protein L1 [Candidatus Hydrothermia bacterium]MDD5572602.1 50S ribosomal protein L1 [Candidatus Hydrothermia bacterium]HOK23155.1 50S ribosomal protein L1 [Candidatus Hydrothermia bacterium]HOL23859.1 50S ribosomal protein L1 [Candidatus Hydrothermia bacterium]